MSNAAFALVLFICAVPLARAADQHRYVDPVFADVTIDKDIVYGSSTPYTDVMQTTPGPLTEYKMDVYSPKGDVVTKRPTIVMVHGGSFVTGDKTQANQVFLAKEFARRGYVAALIDYRLMPAEGKEQPLPTMAANGHAVEDVFGAIRFLRVNAAKFGIDTGRIAVEGHSAGGAAALLANFQHDKVKCENTAGLDAQGKPLASSDFSTAVAIGAAWPFGITKDDHPTKVIIGSKDGTGIHKPQKFFGNQKPWEMMKNAAAGVIELDITIVPDGTHEFYPAYKDKVMEELVPWFKKHLVDAPRVGDDGTSPATAEMRVGGEAK